ncbi:unnamed protein product [Mytilus coruscus]|uniref:Reverse transcriptase domain-containing protein n=1 Tax=Mytilus coruscus TaxID=42192 RepID=A0A6J8ASI4_MYTCO|nr:unnamed protein product [Mytilus coruscus]
MTVLNQKEKHLMSTEVRKMLTKEVIVPVKPCRDQFLSNWFLVPKKDGGQRPVLNLKQLNQHVMYQHFKMEGLFMIKDLLKVGDFMLKIDLKEAYSVFAHQSKPQKISEVQMGRNLVRVHSPTLRVSRGSKVVHQNNETSNRYIAKDGCSYDHISRRHTPHGRKPPKTGNSQKFNIISSTKIRISDKLEKIKLKSNSKDRVSVISDKFSRNDVLSTNRKGISDKNKMQRNVKCRHCDSKAISTVDRKAVILYASNTSSKFAKSFSSNGSSKGSVEGKVLRTKNNSLTNSKRRINLVGNKNRRVQWKGNNNALSRYCDHIRRL